MKSFKNLIIPIITIVLFGILYYSNNYSKISTNILSVLPNSKEKELIKEFESSNNSKILVVAVKGFDEKALNEIKEVEKSLNQIENVELKQKFINQELLNLQLQLHNYVNDFDNNKFLTFNFDKELKRLKNDMTNSFFPTVINDNDPLNLFTNKPAKLGYEFKNNHLIIPDYGYVSLFDINIEKNSFDEYEKVYDEIFSKIDTSNLKIYSPMFFYVENKRAIKDDINKIVIFSSIVLFLLYLVLLRNIKLLLNTTLTLFSSAIFAILVITSFYQEVSIFVLAFGVSISTIAIDYMFHHFVHDYYSEEKGFNNEVFFGFLTTVLVFGFLSSVDFLFTTQICLFSILSLLFSYFIFSFIFPYIGFENKNSFNLNFKLPKINEYIFIVLAIFAIFFGIKNLKFDLDIQTLDYNNKELKSLQTFFKENLSKGYEEIIVKAPNLQELINDVNILNKKHEDIKTPIILLPTKQKFESTNEFLKSAEFRLFKIELIEKGNEYGFEPEYFYNSYVTKEYEEPTLESMEKYGIDIFKFDNNLATIVSIKQSDLQNASTLPFVKILSTKELFETNFEQVKNQLLNFGYIGMIVLTILLLIITRKKFFYAINFMILPIGLILCYSYFVEFNILHLFALFVIISISIDYAIYSSKSLDISTKKAIFYSLVSTFGGFGVLVFSKINALYSIGIIATIGIVGIILLLLFLKEKSGIKSI